MTGPVDVTINVLGEFSVTVGNSPVDPTECRRRQAAALVKILALAPGRRLHREQAMEASCGQSSPSTTRHRG